MRSQRESLVVHYHQLSLKVIQHVGIYSFKGQARIPRYGRRGCEAFQINELILQTCNSCIIKFLIIIRNFSLEESLANERMLDEPAWVWLDWFFQMVDQRAPLVILFFKLGYFPFNYTYQDLQFSIFHIEFELSCGSQRLPLKANPCQGL